MRRAGAPRRLHRRHRGGRPQRPAAGLRRPSRPSPAWVPPATTSPTRGRSSPAPPSAPGHGRPSTVPRADAVAPLVGQPLSGRPALQGSAGRGPAEGGPRPPHPRPGPSRRSRRRPGRARRRRPRRALPPLAAAPRRAAPGRPPVPYRFTVHEMGDALWITCAAEPYSVLATELRRRFPGRPVLISPVAGTPQLAYLAAAGPLRPRPLPGGALVPGTWAAWRRFWRR